MYTSAHVQTRLYTYLRIQKHVDTSLCAQRTHALFYGAYSKYGAKCTSLRLVGRYISARLRAKCSVRTSPEHGLHTSAHGLCTMMHPNAHVCTHCERYLDTFDDAS